MTQRPGSDVPPPDERLPVHKRLARLIDPTVPRQPRNTSTRQDTDPTTRTTPAKGAGVGGAASEEPGAVAGRAGAAEPGTVAGAAGDERAGRASGPPPAAGPVSTSPGPGGSRDEALQADGLVDTEPGALEPTADGSAYSGAESTATAGDRAVGAGSGPGGPVSEAPRPGKAEAAAAEAEEAAVGGGPAERAIEVGEAAGSGDSEPVGGGAMSGWLPRQEEGGYWPELGLAGSSLRVSDGSDPLDHPDAVVAADAAGVESLLRCWVRETGVGRAAGDALRIPLGASGVVLRVAVRYWSPTGWHRFGAARLEGAPHDAAPLDAVTLAALLGREAAYGDRAPRTGQGEAGRARDEAGGEAAELVGRVANSVRCTAEFIAERRSRPADEHGVRFLDAEQSLVLGHPLHPTPKSREGLSDAETRTYSPELRGSFPLHWMAVDRSVLAADSAWTERGRTVPADQLIVRLAAAGHRLPGNCVPLPLHPWQARELRTRSDVATLLDAGLLHDLGPGGPAWYPTSSVRTVCRPGTDAMLKLSLGLRITNSRRENLRKELERGLEVHRLLRTGLAEEWQSAFPREMGFGIVRDPAWLAVTAADGEPVHGLDVVIRNNPFSTTDDAVCIAALTSPRPWPGHPHTRSRLADLIDTLTARTGRPAGAVATEWFLRYLEAVVRPILWLDGTAGIALEAHQQNTLVLLDPDGWPAGGRYRDNQGYYFRRSRRTDLEARLPGIGATSDTFVPDEVADERFAYYLAINNVLGLIGAFGSQRLAGEEILLAAFRRFLADAATAPAAHRSVLPGQLLATPTLRCKANFLTRLHGLDELVGPVDTQSVYVTIPNPLHP